MTGIKEEWLARCAARYRERGGLDADDAMAAAQVCAEEADDCGPEEAADNDMDCWDDDGDAP